MKRHTRNARMVLDRFFARAEKPTREQMELSREKILSRLTSVASEERAEWSEPVPEIRRPFRPFMAAAAVAGVVLALIGITTVIRNRAPRAGEHPAMAEAAAGTLYRVSGSELRVIEVGERIERGAVIRSDGNGAIVGLADGSRIEMRSRSELALEQAEDGVRIRLTTGSVIVNAAQQRAGHLYVQTRDVTVSVVGTVFLVESVETGSRVAVIQGEVHVQQGATLKKLLPGEQVTTAPSLQPVRVAEEISWSPNLEAHLALLQQAVVIAAAIPAQNRQPRQTFDAVTITPNGRPADLLGLGWGAGPECSGRIQQLDSKRLVIVNMNVYTLITLAYGTNCRDSSLAELISGGPAWIKTDRFNIEASIPDGSPSYTYQQLNNHEAPVLQVMIQTMLADRFKLVVHRETREKVVYNLVVVRDGKLKPSENQSTIDPPGDLRPRALKLGPEFVERGMLLAGGRLGMVIDESGTATIKAYGIPIPATFTLLYTQIKDRLIVDKTNLKGLFDLQLQFAATQRVNGVTPATLLPTAPAGPSLFDALEEQLGLKLESVRVPMEVIVIDRAEKPAEN